MKTEAVLLKAHSWVHLRSALSLSLCTGKSVRIIKGGSLLEGHPSARPLFLAIQGICQNLDLGRLELCSGDVLFAPCSIFAMNATIEMNSYCSCTDIILFLLPPLLRQDVRSSLTVYGVTHCAQALAPNQLQQTIFGIGEKLGLLAHVSLRRFGFYGSGGGCCTAKMYPLEKSAKLNASASNMEPRARAGDWSARICVSRIDPEMIDLERGLLHELCGIAEERISVIDIRDCEGPGNAVQILEAGGIPVLSRVFDFYREGGIVGIDESEILSGLHDLARECSAWSTRGILPERLALEMVLLARFMGQNEPPTVPSESIAAMRELVGLFL